VPVTTSPAPGGPQRFTQRVDPCSGQGGDLDDRRGVERCAGQQLVQFGFDRVGAVGCKIGLCQRDDTAADAKERKDLQMLASLRAHAFRQGDDQQGGVDTAGASQHRVHKALMTGDVDEAELVGVGVAEVDGDAAALFLSQPIGIDAGEGFHQRGLAVIDVACRADNHRFPLWVRWGPGRLGIGTAMDKTGFARCEAGLLFPARRRAPSLLGCWDVRLAGNLGVAALRPGPGVHQAPRPGLTA